MRGIAAQLQLPTIGRWLMDSRWRPGNITIWTTNCSSVTLSFGLTRTSQMRPLTSCCRSICSAQFGHLFITLEDETGLANLIIRPDLYQREEAVLHNSSDLLVAGFVQREGKALSLLVRQVVSLTQPVEQR